MSNDLARACQRDVSRETLDKLNHFIAALGEENLRQNLIAKSTLSDIWDRHILDSAQLCGQVPQSINWLDIGSGAGLPGLVIAILTDDPVTLVEPRRLRSEFLQRMVEELQLAKVEVVAAKVEQVIGAFGAITARAVAPLNQLLAMSHRLSRSGTRWVLPKGRSGATELAEAKRNWQGHFQLVPSITDADAVIVVVDQLRPLGGRVGKAGK